MKLQIPFLLLALSAAPALGQATERPAPIIDMHLHASTAAGQGPPPVPVCPGGILPAPRRQDAFGLADVMACSEPLLSAPTDEEIMHRTLALMERYNVIGVTSGPRQLVLQWQAAAPHRIIPAGSHASPDSIRAWVADGTFDVLGELGFQYHGLEPEDDLPQQYFALAEELDLPVGLHVGPGPPGAPYFAAPQYRMRLSSPLLLEETLVRRPNLRLYVMHAAWPFLDEMVALMWAHPQVYVDLGVISWAIPRAEFHRYLQRLVEAGFGKRILFGSDQMIWPETLELAIQNIENAAFLSAEQKRDIFYNNAARFLRLGEDTIAEHHRGMAVREISPAQSR
jgi:uncharacterized protein